MCRLAEGDTSWVRELVSRDADICTVLDELGIELLIQRLPLCCVVHQRALSALRSGRDLRCCRSLEFGNDSGMLAVAVSTLVLFLHDAVHQARSVVGDHFVKAIS